MSASSCADTFACVTAAWRAHEAELHGFLRHRVSDTTAADDLLQDVFLKAMRAGRGFCSLNDPRAWLFQVARNTLVDRVRASRDCEPLHEHEQHLVAPEVDAAAPVDALSACLVRVLGELKPEDADVLRQCDLAGVTQRAYAEQQGLSLPAVKSRLLRARERLRDRMSTVCRVRFDPADGRVCGHEGRAQPLADGPEPPAR